MTSPVPEDITADLPVIIEDLLVQASALSTVGADTGVDELLTQVTELQTSRTEA